MLASPRFHSWRGAEERSEGGQEHSEYRWCFSLTPALKKAFNPRDKHADLPVEKRSLSEGISPCKHGPVLR